MILVFFVLFLKTFSLKCFSDNINDVSFKLQLTVVEHDVLNDFIFFIFEDFDISVKVILRVKSNFVLILNFLLFLFF